MSGQIPLHMVQNMKHIGRPPAGAGTMGRFTQWWWWHVCIGIMTGAILILAVLIAVFAILTYNKVK